MAEKNIKSRIQHKHDTESNWKRATNFIPKEGEIIIYDPEDGIIEYPRIKIGNGSQPIGMLPFIAAEQSNKLSNIGDITNQTPLQIKLKLGSVNAFAVGYFDSDENGHCPALIITYPDTGDFFLSPKEIYQITWRDFNTYYRIGNSSDNEWSEWISSIPSLMDLGIDATLEEINYLTGTKSNIQTQINNLSTEINAIDWFKKGTSIPENSDLDNYKTPGKYYVNSGSISTTLNNCPVNNDNFVLYVFSRTSSDTSSLGQIIITLGSFIYLRNTSSNNQWRPWYRMAKYDEMTSYADSVGEQIKNDLLNGAGTAYDTLKELADLIVDNDDAIEALNKLINERTIIAGKGLTGGGNLSTNRTLNIGAGAGISVNDDDISLTASGVTAGTYGPSLSVSGVHNATMNVPEITVDEYGRVTNIVNRVYTSIDNNTTYSEASTSTSGLMSAADKTKLNGIATGAEVNQNAFGKITVGSTTITADAKVDTLTIAGSNVTITPDATNDKVTIGITKDNVTTALGYTPPTTDTTYGVVSTAKDGLAPKRDGSTTKYLRADGTWAVPPDTNTTYSDATQSTAGLMSAADKAKLDGIASGATANKGDITGVTAGNGLTGGATSGSATLNVGAGTGIEVTADAVGLATSGVTAGTYGPSADVNGSDDATIVVPEITVDAYGRLTGVTNRTYTSVNTDTKVTQTVRTTNGEFPILLRGTSAGTDTTTTTTTFAKAVTINPSKSTVTATTFKGGLTTNSNNIILSTTTNYSSTLPTSGVEGQLYFVEEDTSLPLGGTAGQLLVKNSSNNGDALWKTLYTVPEGGFTNQILVKSSATNGDATWTSDYLPASGGTMTGGIRMKGYDIHLLSPSETSDDSADIVFLYGNEQEKCRIYTYANPTSYRGPEYRAYAKDGTLYGTGHLWASGESITAAAWNDYAEYRESDCEDFGYVLMENGDDTLSKTTERLSHFAGISSDTWGFAQGETDKAKTPIAVAGRVLAYPYQNRNNYKPGDCVCAAPNGTVDIMTREEIINWPDRIVGIVSCVPEYEEWGGGPDRPSVKVNNRIWIKIK